MQLRYVAAPAAFLGRPVETLMPVGVVRRRKEGEIQGEGTRRAREPSLAERVVQMTWGTFQRSKEYPDLHALNKGRLSCF
jgi:hypothetical protein